MKNRDLSKSTVPQLWEMFRSGLATSAEGLMTAALAWRELERRGTDMTRCRTPLTNRLTAVAEGRLAAAALLRYAHSPAFLDSIIGTDLDTQISMSGPDYKVAAVVRDDGTSMMLRPDDMTLMQIKRVFEGGRVRSVAEQKKLLPPKVVEVPGYTRRTPGASSAPDVGKSGHASMGDIAGFTWLKLSTQQIKHLREAAVRYRMTLPELVVHALQDAGFIEPVPEAPKTKTPRSVRHGSNGRFVSASPA